MWQIYWPSVTHIHWLFPAKWQIYWPSVPHIHRLFPQLTLVTIRKDVEPYVRSNRLAEFKHFSLDLTKTVKFTWKECRWKYICLIFLAAILRSSFLSKIIQWITYLRSSCVQKHLCLCLHEVFLFVSRFKWKLSELINFSKLGQYENSPS